MAVKNIQINYNNGTGYDTLYPQTLAANIGDLSTNYYNKTEIGNSFYTKTQVDSLLSNLSTSPWTKVGQYVSTSNGVFLYDVSSIWRKPLVVTWDSYVGATQRYDTTEMIYTTVTLGKNTFGFTCLMDSDGTSYIQNYETTGNLKPFLLLIPVAGKLFGADSSTDDSILYLVLSSSWTTKHKFSPSAWNTYTETICDFSNSEFYFGVYIENLDRDGISFTWKVSLYTMDFPAA